MAASSKPLRRTLGTLRGLSLAGQPQGLFFFYDLTQVTPTRRNLLFHRFGAQGFSCFFLGHSGANRFGPRSHPGLAFLSRGSFLASYGPSFALGQQAVDLYPFLNPPFCGLAAGHFFLTVSAISEASEMGPALVSGTLDAVGRPLVTSLFLLTAQVVAFFP